MKKRISSLLLAAVMLLGILSGCGGNNSNPPSDGTQQPSSGADAQQPSGAAGGEIVKESPMLAEMVSAGTIPALADRLPSDADVYVETAYTPEGEAPVYGGTMRTPNGGM